MKKIGLIFLGLVGLALMVTGEIPGQCDNSKIVETGEPGKAAQEINLFLAKEIDNVTITEAEAIQLIKERLNLLPIENLNICFESNLGRVTGKTRLLNLPINFMVAGKISFESVNPQAEIVAVEVGRSRLIPGLNRLLTRITERQLNQKLKGIFVGYPYRVIFEPTQVSLIR